MSLAAENQQRPLERLASFRFTYIAIAIFILAYVFTIPLAENRLAKYFSEIAAQAIQIEPNPHHSIPTHIATQLHTAIHESAWVRLGGIRVHALAIAADGHTAIYASIPLTDPLTNPQDRGEHLLPARINLAVSIPHNALLANAILVFYAGILITTLTLYTRRLTDRESAELAALQASREALNEHVTEIKQKLDTVQQRLDEVEPEHSLYVEEVESLEAERKALEELLEDASEDLADKNTEIDLLRNEIQKRNGGKNKILRESQLFERRFRTLYKNLEMDEHAIENLVALRDHSLQLRAEEVLKRLSDDPEKIVIRRKIGGLSSNLPIFEVGFAGKGRIYYTAGQSRRFRVLAIGAKNSQKSDLEYLSKWVEKS